MGVNLLSLTQFIAFDAVLSITLYVLGPEEVDGRGEREGRERYKIEEG